MNTIACVHVYLVYSVLKRICQSIGQSFRLRSAFPRFALPKTDFLTGFLSLPRSFYGKPFVIQRPAKRLISQTDKTERNTKWHQTFFNKAHANRRYMTELTGHIPMRNDAFFDTEIMVLLSVLVDISRELLYLYMSVNELRDFM